MGDWAAAVLSAGCKNPEVLKRLLQSPDRAFEISPSGDRRPAYAARSIHPSANVARRHLTVGQLAMAVALARASENCPDPDSLGSRKSAAR
jgi:hypothetical protein